MQVDKRERAAADIDVADGQETAVELVAASSRIVVRAKRADGSPLAEAQALRWTISRSGGQRIELGERGGDYQISVFDPKDGGGADSIVVAEGRTVARSLELRQ